MQTVRHAHAPAVEGLEHRTLLSTVVVTSGADAGPGSFRAAVERANADARVDAIVFSPNVDEVELESAAVFRGGQDLSINGRGAEVGAADGGEGAFDLFTATGGGDLSLSRIGFAGGRDGVVVRTPADATGTIRVSLRDVSIEDNAEFGLWVDDLANASPASIDLSLSGTSILDNGTAALDKDGIRVDERGAGGITATITNSRLNGNGAEGIELDEGGDGDVRLSAAGSTFNDNGFFSEEDFDDGIDVDEADAGDVVVSLRASQVNGNFDEGVDLNEGGDGDLTLIASDLEASGNTDEGVALEELDAGGIFAGLTAVRLNDNSADGFQAEEFGEGDLLVAIAGSRITNNDGAGVKVEQEGPGRGLLALAGLRFADNGEGDVDAEGVKVVGA